MSQHQLSTEVFVRHLLIFIVTALALVLANSVASATYAGERVQVALSSSESASFDTQLNEAKMNIQQYAEDQIWLYSVTQQEGSFDTQLNQALNQIRKN